MPIQAYKNATEKSTYVVNLTFAEESGNPVTPLSVQWTLFRAGGVVVNERENVTATPAETVSVVLSGDDLEIFTDDDRKRTLKVEATYNSTYGDGLPLKEELVFFIDDLTQVT